MAKNPQTDKDLFNELFAPCLPYLERKAPTYLRGAEHRAEDALSETYEKAYREFGTHDRSKKFQNWIEKILKNTCLDILDRIKNDPLENISELEVFDRITGEDKIRDQNPIDLQEARIWTEDEDGFHSLIPERKLLDNPLVEKSYHIDTSTPGFIEILFIEEVHNPDSEHLNKDKSILGTFSPDDPEALKQALKDKSKSEAIEKALKKLDTTAPRGKSRLLTLRWDERAPVPHQSVELFCDAVRGIPIEKTCKRLKISVKHGRVLLSRFKKKVEEDRKKRNATL